jgi:hypothetical protein
MPTALLDIVTVEQIKKVMDEVVERFLIPRFHELGMPATGDWEKAVSGEAEPNRGIITGLDYTDQLVHGQAPTTVPLTDLKRWAKAKFRINDRAAQTIAVRVQKKIQREGTSWYEKGGSDLLEVLEEPQVLNFITSSLGQVATIKISDHLIRQFEEL